MIKAFFLPSDCKICYWGRMSAMMGLGAVGAASDAFVGQVIIGTAVVLTSAAIVAKWLVTKFG